MNIPDSEQEFQDPPPGWFDCVEHNYYGGHIPCPKCDALKEKPVEQLGRRL